MQPQNPNGQIQNLYIESLRSKTRTGLFVCQIQGGLYEIHDCLHNDFYNTSHPSFSCKFAEILTNFTLTSISSVLNIQCVNLIRSVL